MIHSLLGPSVCRFLLNNFVKILKGEQKNAYIFKIQIARLVLIAKSVTHTVRTAKKSIFGIIRTIPLLRIVKDLRKPAGLQQTLNGSCQSKF